VSEQVEVTVKINPEPHPNNCVTLGLKDYDLESLILYSDLEYFWISIRVEKKCTGVTYLERTWEVLNLNEEFWEEFENDDTLIVVYREEIERLPRNKDIEMRVTQVYEINGVEYKIAYDFNLLVARDVLVTELTYSTVVNLDETSSYGLDASSSYDLEELGSDKTNGVVCSWECPDEYVTAKLCASSKVYDTCNLSFDSQDVLSASNFESELKSYPLSFILTLTKDNRETTATYYVTVLSDGSYPLCWITQDNAVALNSFTFFNLNCDDITIKDNEDLTMKWSLFDNKGVKLQKSEGSDTQMDTSNWYRVNSYLLSDSDYAEVECEVDYFGKTMKTRIRVEGSNRASVFRTSTIRQRSSHVYAYNNELALVPNSKWAST
jgi:hypothetical protein